MSVSVAGGLASAEEPTVGETVEYERRGEPGSSGLTLEELEEHEMDMQMAEGDPQGSGAHRGSDNDTDEYLDITSSRKKSFVVSPVYTVEYSRDKVYEMTLNDIAIMRRRSDSYFNATHILKIAGITKAKRAKILERDIHTGVHEKVQGGYGKYQGTWIPYERAVALAQQYGVYELLKDIFIYNPNGVATPSKAQAMENLKHVNYDYESRLSRTYSSLTDLDNNDDFMESPSKKFKTNSNVGLGLVRANSSSGLDFELFSHDINIANPNAPFALEPIDSVLYLTRGNTKYDYNSLKNFISSIFINEMTDKDLTELLDLSEDELRKLDFDVSMDDSGNSALHWAATLGNVSLVRQLVKYGSNRIRGNNNGETALIRAILVKNSFESGTFDNLLDYFYPCITILDHQGRSVLHHILLNSGIKRRSSACKYYLETLLEWIVKKGSYLPLPQSLSLGRFMAEVVNVMDKNGDTCLNIAARIGNKAIVQQLLDIGADHTIANKAGLRPIDFGITVDPLNPSTALLASFTNNQFGLSQSGSLLQNHTQLHSQLQLHQQSSKKIMSSLKNLLTSLDREFDDEIKTKQLLIDDIHSKLREQTVKLTDARKKLEILNSSETQISELNDKIHNIDKLIEEEETRFKEQTKDLVGNFDDFNGDFDADEPFRVWEVYNEISKLITEEDLSQDEDALIGKLKSKLDPSVLESVQSPHSIILKARIKAYQKNENLLNEKISNLNRSLDLKEAKYKKIISLSTGIPDDKIDSMLEELIKAVESDGNNGDVDIQRVNDFLSKTES